MAKATLPKIDPPAPATEEPMKMRNLRVDDATWDAASARAKADGIALSEVIRHYLREYAESR
jgi:antitoxin component of RelBE/YafQ-DinJ toxin-antitoxin module